MGAPAAPPISSLSVAGGGARPTLPAGAPAADPALPRSLPTLRAFMLGPLTSMPGAAASASPSARTITVRRAAGRAMAWDGFWAAGRRRATAAGAALATRADCMVGTGCGGGWGLAMSVQGRNARAEGKRGGLILLAPSLTASRAVAANWQATLRRPQGCFDRLYMQHRRTGEPARAACPNLSAALLPSSFNWAAHVAAGVARGGARGCDAVGLARRPAG